MWKISFVIEMKKIMNTIVLTLKIKSFSAATALMLAILPGIALASTLGSGGGTGGTEFQTFYTFIYSAATGYLGRSIAIVGGLIGLGIGAGMGKALPAVMGVFLAIFGVLGPAIINALFTSATI